MLIESASNALKSQLDGRLTTPEAALTEFVTCAYSDILKKRLPVQEAYRDQNHEKLLTPLAGRKKSQM